MPYKSDAQRKFMHAKHPEIAARWDAEKKKGKLISKAREDWGKAVVAGTAAGALANQFPRVQDIARERKRKKKATFKKMLLPISDDPYFNQEAAQKTFDLIMKMDDDTAAVFCHIVASDLLEQEIEKNLGTLQQHLDEVLAVRTERVKKALLRQVHKGTGDPIMTAGMLDSFLELIHKDVDIPNWEFERKIKRDPSSGRFRTKINPTTAKKPINEKTAAAIGIKGTDKKAYGQLSAKQQAEYQNQYQQVGRFLDAVNAATNGKGNNKVLLHYKDHTTGEVYADEHTGGKPPVEALLDKNTTIIGAEALPTTLTAGGAAFSLAGAMGSQMTPGQVEAVNAAEKGGMKWSDDWLKAGEAKPESSNARLYGRTKALGDAAYEMGAPGSKIQLAGKMASIVGQYGPQAEAVLGPSARKTAYRYRGTERTPDKRLVREYGQAIERGKQIGPVDVWGEREENRIRRARGAGPQPFGSETGVRAKGSQRQVGQGPPTARGIQQQVAEREARAGRAPEWQERELGRRAVVNYLSERLPRKDYYKLHLEAGNTPPSEGVIINSEGQIVSQASGYGDDHYLPFNLKNLKGLKGGEYVRTRSVGGLTSEDIYTGLISGARRVTVVSRSGTFTMEFQPDFRGGRRHNDKARRMTRRYEHILDAVQSEQVERQDIPPAWKKVIADEVREEYGPGASRAMIRQEIDAREREFKENPDINGRDLDRAEAAISAFEAQGQMGLVSSEDVKNYRSEVMNELRNMKEIRFRLNGVGYQAALDSLEEQFPYYIHAASWPKQEHLEEFERDLGYVEPARNRPTEAKAGWHGTAGKERSGKFSAAYADDQRGMPGAPPPKGAPRAGFKAVEATPEGKTRTSPVSDRDRAKDAAEEAFQQAEAKIKTKDAATALHMAARNVPPPQGATPPEWWGFDEDRFRQYVEAPANLSKFQAFMEQNAAAYSQLNPSAWQQYHNAIGTTSATKYTPENAHIWPPAHPYTFRGEGEAFRPNAPAGVVQAQMHKIDRETFSLTQNKPLSELTDDEMKTEVNTIRTVMEVQQGMKGSNSEELAAMLSGHFAASPALVTRFFKDGPEKHLRAVHQMRYLKRNPGSGPAPSAGGGAAPSPPSAPPPKTPAGPPNRPTPVAPQAGRLEPVAEKLTPEQQKGKEDHLAKRRGLYVDKLEDEALNGNMDNDTRNKLLYYSREIKHMPAFEVADLNAMVGELMKDDPALLKEIEARIEREPMNR